MPLPDDSFSSSEHANNRSGDLELHPKPKIGEVYIATVTTTSNPSLFYVSFMQNTRFFIYTWAEWTQTFAFVFRFDSMLTTQHTIRWSMTCGKSAKNPIKFCRRMTSNWIICMRPDCKTAIGIGRCKSFEILNNLSKQKYSSTFLLLFVLLSVNVQAFPTNETVTVQSWDYGDIDHLSINALRSLRGTYRKLHQMIFCACLHGNTLRHFMSMSVTHSIG